MSMLIHRSESDKVNLSGKARKPYWPILGVWFCHNQINCGALCDCIRVDNIQEAYASVKFKHSL